MIKKFTNNLIEITISANNEKLIFEYNDKSTAKYKIHNTDNRYIGIENKKYYLIETEPQINKRLLDINFDNCIFLIEVDFSGAEFGKDINFVGATFSKKAGFSGATFSKEANFSEATFSEVANFYAANIKTILSFD